MPCVEQAIMSSGASKAQIYRQHALMTASFQRLTADQSCGSHWSALLSQTSVCSANQWQMLEQSQQLLC